MKVANDQVYLKILLALITYMATNFVKVMCNKNVLLLFSGTLNSFYALALSNFEQKFEKKNVNSSQRRENRKKADSVVVPTFHECQKKKRCHWDGIHSGKEELLLPTSLPSNLRVRHHRRRQKNDTKILQNSLLLIKNYQTKRTIRLSNFWN